MRIRLAKDEDYVKIARLRLQTIRNVNSKDYPKVTIDNWSARTNTKKIREDADKHKRWVATEKDKIIGFCDHNFQCEISRIYVHKDYLGKGIGSRLLKIAEDSLIKQGCKKINIEATITAVKFYKKNGYKIIKKNYDKGDKRSLFYKMSKKIK